MAAIGGLRSDARRNREAVIEAAVELLSRRPGATMQEIADASQLGRTTVYRHFATRDDLLRALFARAVGEARGVAAEIAAEPIPAAAALRRLGPRIVAIGARYQFLHVHATIREQMLDAADAESGDPFADFLSAAQLRGEIRNDFPVRWMQALLRGVATAAMNELNAARIGEAEAGALLGETLVAALAPAAEPARAPAPSAS